MFSGLVNFLFGGEAKQHVPVDSAVDVANVLELGDSFLDEDYVPNANNDEDKENAHELIDFETNEDDDWLLVNVSPANRLEFEEEMCLKGSAESQPSSETIIQERLQHTSLTVGISSKVKNSVEANQLQSEPEKKCILWPTKSVPILPREVYISHKRLKHRDAVWQTVPDLEHFTQVDWLQFEGEMCLKGPPGFQQSCPTALQKRLQQRSFTLKISAKAKNSVEAKKLQSKPQEVCLTRPTKSLPKLGYIAHKRLKHEDAVQETLSGTECITQENIAQPDREMLTSRSAEPLSSIAAPNIYNIKGNNRITTDIECYFQEWDKYKAREWVEPDKLPCLTHSSRPMLFPRRSAHSIRRLLRTFPVREEYKVGPANHPPPEFPYFEKVQEILRSIQNHVAANISKPPPSKAEALLEHVQRVKPQQKAREQDIRKYLAPAQIDRQNKVKLYEGKAKNNRRKDLWRCHSGANNNRKCC